MKLTSKKKLVQENQKLYERVNELKKQATQLENENELLRKANEELYLEGKQDAFKEMNELANEHSPIKFIKIPKKKSGNIKEGEADELANNSDSLPDSSFSYYIAIN